MDMQENKTENQKNKITVFFKEHWVLLTICIMPLYGIGYPKIIRLLKIILGDCHTVRSARLAMTI